MNTFRPAKGRRARQRRRNPNAARQAPSPGADIGSGAVPLHGAAPAATALPKAARPAAPRLRRNVGIIIRNRQGKVLAGLRAHASGDKAWQLPQGGIEGRELPSTAAYRELREETGIDPRAVRLVKELDHWIDYHLPPDMTHGRRFSGQTQKWFLFEYLEEGLPNLKRATDEEFEQLAWVDFDWLTNHVIAFRKVVYKTLKKEFGL